MTAHREGGSDPWYGGIRRRIGALPRVTRTISIAVVSSLLTVGLVERSGFLQRFELDAFDALLRSIPDQGLDQRLLIVSVTESDTAQYGNPLNDATLAQLIATLLDKNPGAIGIDLYRNVDYPPGSDKLTEQLRSPQVVGIRYVGSDTETGQVPAPPALPRDRVGFSDLVIDPDGVVRRALLYVGGDPGFFSFALRSVLVGLPPEETRFRVGDEALYLGEQSIARLRDFSGGYAQADSSGYQTVLRYRSRRQPAEIVPVSDVLEGYVRRDQVEGRIVLIGRTDASLSDDFYTPYSPGLIDDDFTMSGVVVHAQIASQLLDIVDGRPAQYSFFSRMGELAWMMMWATLAALITWSMRNPVLALFSLPIIPFIIMLAGWFAVARLFWPPLVAPGLAALIASVIVSVEKHLRRTTHDAVTGLPDRNIFLKRIRSALERSRQDAVIAVAFLDLDRFQVINKAMGHTAGDRLLEMISTRLRSWLGGSRDLARIGGDEFAVLFFGPDAAAIEDRVREMRQMLSEPMLVESRRLSVTVSVGVAYADDKNSQRPEIMLRDAHTAMYRAKARKEVQLETYSSDMGHQALVRLDLESDLLDAMENKEFFLVYQPIIHLQSGALTGFEALLRWHSAKRGLIGPGDFIPILEETGMIVPLGKWILETACRQTEEWRQAHSELDLKVHVNLSVRQINEPGLEQTVSQTLARTGLSPAALRLEFTESMIMRDVESIHQLMTALKLLGVGLAIDDFGTGYSSLSYLHRFPVDTLKIDQAFVKNLTSREEDKNIVHTIVAIGHRLEMTLVAEGIENQQQAEILRSAGCHFAQGFLYARPLPAKDAAELIASGGQFNCVEKGL